MNKRFIPVASDFMKPYDQQKLIDIYLPIFEKYSIIQSSEPLVDSDNYFFILTGGTENNFLKFLSKMDNHKSIKLVAIGMNLLFIFQSLII